MYRRTLLFLAPVASTVVLSMAVSPAAAQGYLPVTPQRNFSGLVSGYEAWQLGEVRRQSEIARQVDLNADMYWRWSGVSSFYPGVFEPWPMVPGSIWGWPAAVSPPRVSPTRPGVYLPPAPIAPGGMQPPGMFAPMPDQDWEAELPAAAPQAGTPTLAPRNRAIEGPREF